MSFRTKSGKEQHISSGLSKGLKLLPDTGGYLAAVGLAGYWVTTSEFQLFFGSSGDNAGQSTPSLDAKQYVAQLTGLAKRGLESLFAGPEAGALYREYQAALAGAVLAAVLLALAVYLLWRTRPPMVRLMPLARIAVVAALIGLAVRIVIFDYPARTVKNITKPQDVSVALDQNSSAIALWRIFTCSRLTVAPTQPWEHVQLARCTQNTYQDARGAYSGVRFSYAWLTFGILVLLVMGTALLVADKVTLQTAALRAVAIAAAGLLLFTSSDWLGRYDPRSEFKAVSTKAGIKGYVIEQSVAKDGDGAKTSTGDSLRLLVAVADPCSDGSTQTQWQMQRTAASDIISESSGNPILLVLASSVCKAPPPPKPPG